MLKTGYVYRDRYFRKQKIGLAGCCEQLRSPSGCSVRSAVSPAVFLFPANSNLDPSQPDSSMVLRLFLRLVSIRVNPC